MSPQRAEVIARLLALDPVVARRELERIVLQSLNTFLQRAPSESLGPRDRFVEVGFDSLRALDFTTQLETQLLCELRPTLLFDYPTPSALVEHLADRVLGLPPTGASGAREEPPDLAQELEQLGDLSDAEARVLLARQSRKLRRLERERVEPVAIVGMACRFPMGVESPEALWEVFAAGQSLVSDVPETRWPMAELYHPQRNVPGRMNTRRAAMLDDIAGFDARFFNLSPREANELDPQHRLLLEGCWSALEDANIAAATLHGAAVGVFAGIKQAEYFDGLKTGLPEQTTAYRGTGNSASTAVGRVSHFFGFTGPCLPVDTACSSSLVAIHLAVQSLRRGECSLALAGGVNVLVDPHISISLSKANMLSPDGECKVFDAAANGYVRAEGCAMLVLKPLSQAQADGDRIHAVIRGTAINQDGASGGLTVPNGPAQEAVVRAALTDAQVQPYQVGYIEAHGTGTELGDPIEINALDGVFGGDERFHGQPLYVGSGKSNHGHMECAAGVAGVLRGVLALQHEIIPPNLHFSVPNPRIAWDKTVIEVAAQPIPWRRGSAARILGVSSFGFGGTNSHVVIEEPPVPRKARRGRPARPELIPLSAQSDADLGQLARRYAERLRRDPPVLSSLAASAGAGRSHLLHRAAFVVDDTEQLAAKLESFVRGETPAGSVTGTAARMEPDVAFMFTGQGAQHAGMGRDLYHCEPSFREMVDHCGEILDRPLGVPLRELLFGDSSALLDETRYAQPATVAYQIALVALWQSWGVRPRWVLGHSIGEYAAAWSAGALSLEQVLRLAEARGRLMDSLPERGGMAAISASVEQLAPLVAEHSEDLCIAAHNGPRSVVLSGRSGALGTVCAELEAHGIKAVPLSVSHAFHSCLMDPMLYAFRELAPKASGRPLDREWISTLCPEREPAADADYWVRHVREPVRFDEAVQRLHSAGCHTYVEIGPSTTLLAMARGCLRDVEGQFIPSQHPRRHGRQTALSALARLYVLGSNPVWSALSDNDQPKADLPGYPFQRRRHWLEFEDSSPVRGDQVHPLLGVELPLPATGDVQIAYASVLRDSAPAYLAGHRVGEGPVFPAAGYLELAFALCPAEARNVAELEIRAPLQLDNRGRQLVSVVRGGERAGGAVSSRVQGGAWVAHSTFAFAPALTVPEQQPKIDLSALRTQCQEELPVEALYQRYAERGLQYSGVFCSVRELWLGSEEVLARIAVDPGEFDGSGYLAHPAIVDSCFQAAGALLFDSDDMLLPVHIEHARMHAPLGVELWCTARVRERNHDAVRLDVTLFDGDGACLLEVHGLRLVPTTAFRSGAARERSLLCSTQWVVSTDTLSVAAAEAADDSWLLLADGGGVAEGLEWLLDERGKRVSVLSQDQVDASDGRFLDRVFADLGGSVDNIVYLWTLDDAPGEPGDSELHARRLRPLLDLVHAYQRAGASPARLFLVTREAQQVGDARQSVDLSQTPVWGFAVALSLELPDLELRCIDLPAVGAAHATPLLLRELLIRDGERRVALRGGQRHVARLLEGLDRANALAVPDDSEGYELRTSAYGTLQNLALRPMAPRPPGPGEVQIRVSAGALNFKDVLHAMGVLAEFAERRGIERAEDQPLGLECTGRIIALGDGVEGLHVGDAVLALVDGCMASHVTVTAEHVALKPEGWGIAEAAGLQTVFLTTAYGLLVLAGLQPGDRVLIHAAAGGVGQAAVQLCQWVGAEIYATASPAKWDHLRSQGVEHVMNSRTLDYSDEILRLTKGAGVDVVLNSLGGDNIPKSLATLGKGGRFVEIGKVDIWNASQMTEARPDVAYHTFDLGEALGDQVKYSELLERLRAPLSSGAIRPVPTRTFSVTEARQAFQLLSSGKTIGKIVLTMPEPTQSVGQALVRTDRAYLVSGGLGALGLHTARWLATRGAGAIVLLGRSEPNQEAARVLDELREGGVRVAAVSADVADRNQLFDTLDGLARELPPIGGIIHAAGVLADGLAEGQDWQRTWQVMAPKVAGGWNLHLWSLKHELDFFVCYASIASVVGSAGQTAYAAANAFLEGLAWTRRRADLPATSIHWGGWAGAGMAGAQPRAMRQRMARMGLHQLTPQRAFQAMERALASGHSQAVIADVSWPTYARAVPSEAATFLSALGESATRDAATTRTGARAALLEAASDERQPMLVGLVSKHLATVLGLDGDGDLAPDSRFAELGVDSLLSIDLRTLLEQDIEVSLPASALSDHPSLLALASYIDGLLPSSLQKSA